MFIRFSRYVFCCLISLFSLSAHASSFTDRPEVKAYIAETAKKYDFNQEQLEGWFNTVQVQTAILGSISKPHEKMPWNKYKQIFLQQERIQQGIEFSKKYKTTLADAEKKYGVPAPIIVAILGVETYYGKQQGTYRVLDSLSTLSFNYPPREPFFKKELTEFLLLCREMNVSPTSIYGSYAGAIGQAQFMPSSYRYYAVDSSDKGHSDLRKNPHDAIYSIANYLNKNGWRADEPIATPAKISGSAYRRLDIESRKPLYTLTQLRSYGVTPAYYPPVVPQEPVGLVQLDTTGAPEYWIGFKDFYVITSYNVSKQYAMAVFLLASDIQRGMGIEK